MLDDSRWFADPATRVRHRLAFCAGGLSAAGDPESEGRWLGRLYGVAHEAADDGVEAGMIRVVLEALCASFGAGE